MKKYVMDGFKTPIGIDTSEDVMHLQRVLGVTQDGLWGPKTQNAYDRFAMANANSNTPLQTFYLRRYRQHEEITWFDSGNEHKTSGKLCYARL